MLNSVEYAAYVNMKGRIHYTWLGHGDCPPPLCPCTHYYLRLQDLDHKS